MDKQVGVSLLSCPWLQAMERKVARASGERSDSEKRELTRKIEELQSTLDGKNSEHSMLLAQVSAPRSGVGVTACNSWPARL